MPEGPLSAARGGVHVQVRLRPRAKEDRLLGIAEGPQGRALRAAVTAAPEAGNANAALLALLSREWAIPRRDLAIVAGHRSRSKIVRVAGEPASLSRRLAAMIAALAGG